MLQLTLLQLFLRWIAKPYNFISLKKIYKYKNKFQIYKSASSLLPEAILNLQVSAFDETLEREIYALNLEIRTLWLFSSQRCRLFSLSQVKCPDIVKLY